MLKLKEEEEEEEEEESVYCLYQGKYKKEG
jgi:hypothetical protein